MRSCETFLCAGYRFPRPVSRRLWTRHPSVWTQLVSTSKGCRTFEVLHAARYTKTGRRCVPLHAGIQVVGLDTGRWTRRSTILVYASVLHPPWRASAAIVSNRGNAEPMDWDQRAEA